MDNYTVNFIIIGNPNVGKTNIVYRFVNGEFISDYQNTITVDFSTKKVKIDNKILKLQIWDTGGSEKFSSIRQPYYKNAACAIIVYDITNEESFKSIDKWIEECDYCYNNNLIIALVGNKSDLSKDRKVSEEDGKKLKERYNKYNIEFYESSALNGYNIEEIFFNSCRKVNELIKNENEGNGIEINNEDNEDNEIYDKTILRISLVNKNEKNNNNNNNNITNKTCSGC